MTTLVKFLKSFFVLSRGSARVGGIRIKRRQISRTKSALIIILGFFTVVGFFLGISSNLALSEIRQALIGG